MKTFLRYKLYTNKLAVTLLVIDCVFWFAGAYFYIDLISKNLK